MGAARVAARASLGTGQLWCGVCGGCRNAPHRERVPGRRVGGPTLGAVEGGSVKAEAAWWNEESAGADLYLATAKEALAELFETNASQVFYVRQLEVRLEKRFFHWVTARAINELIQEGVVRSEEAALLGPTRVKFVFHRSHRYYRRQIKGMLELIRAYSRPEIAGACGEQADVLFFNAFMGRGFVARGQDVNEFEGKKWSETNHNLDFIMERDGFTYGCEVKNTWDYMDGEEMRIKLDICEHLAVTPLFVMRFAPKTYINEIAGRGGFALLFEAQIYPFGQERLAKRIAEELGLPAVCPRALPSGIVERFVRWHAGRVV